MPCYSVWDVFNNFLLIDATVRSKISSDQKRFFIALSLYPLSFFATTPFKWTKYLTHHIWRGVSYSQQHSFNLCMIKDDWSLFFYLKIDIFNYGFFLNYFQIYAPCRDNQNTFTNEKSNISYSLLLRRSSRSRTQ